MMPADTSTGQQRSAGLTGVAALLAVSFVMQFDAGRDAVIWTVAAASIAILAYIGWQFAPRWALRPEPTVNCIDHLRNLTPYQFEVKTAKMLRRAGFTRIRVAGGSGDNGADVVATSPLGHRTIVQCKRYAITNRVGPAEIREFKGGMVYHHADVGMFVTTGYLTRQAQDVANRLGIIIVDADGIIRGVIDEARQAGIA